MYRYIPFCANPAHNLTSRYTFAGKSGKGPLGDSLMEVDHASGVILAALRTLHVEEDTIVFVTGDNGPPEDQCDWGGSKGPFLGAASKTVAGGGGSSGKITSWEGGHREVGIAAWPGRIAHHTVSHALTSTMDFFPTIASLIGASLPTDRAYDGLDMAPVLFDGAKTLHPHLVFSVTGRAYGNGVRRVLLPPSLLRALHCVCTLVWSNGK